MHCFWPILRKDYECLEQLPLRRRDWPDLEPVDNLITSGSYYFEVGKPVILLWNWEASHTTLKLGDRGATLKSEIAKLINFMTKLFGNLSSFSWNLMSKFVFLIPEWFTKQEEADARKNFTQVSSFHEWDVRSVIPTGLCFKSMFVNIHFWAKSIYAVRQFTRHQSLTGQKPQRLRELSFLRWNTLFQDMIHSISDTHPLIVNVGCSVSLKGRSRSNFVAAFLDFPKKASAHNVMANYIPFCSWILFDQQLVSQLDLSWIWWCIR